MRAGKFARFAAVILACMMVFVLVGAVSAAKPKLKIAMVTDTAGLGDKSFNDSAYAGLKDAGKTLKVDTKVLESKKMEDYETNLRMLATEKYDMVWAVGFLMTDAVQKVAAQFPDVKFGLIDAVVDAPNVLSVTFKEHEGSFLQGVVAGLATKTNLIGFVGGMEFPLIIKFEVGFIAGVKAANPKAKVLVAYTGSFGDAVKGKELALTQYSQGADIIYHASGGCGAGVFEAAKEKNLMAIGVDMDQSAEAPKNIVSSMVKGVGAGLYAGTKTLVEGKFKGGAVELGLRENGVGTAFSTTVDQKLLRTKFKDIKNQVSEYNAKIVKGKLKVPTLRAELSK